MLAAEMRLISLIAILALAACGVRDPQSITAASMGIVPVAASPTFPIEIDATKMQVAARTGVAQCGGFTYPLDGVDAFDGAMRSAVLAADARPTPQRVVVVGEEIVPRFAFRGINVFRAAVEPTVLVRASIRVDRRGQAARTEDVQWTGRSSVETGDLCAAVAQAMADAYRDALRGLAGQITERVRGAR